MAIPSEQWIDNLIFTPISVNKTKLNNKKTLWNDFLDKRVIQTKLIDKFIKNLRCFSIGLIRKQELRGCVNLINDKSDIDSVVTNTMIKKIENKLKKIPVINLNSQLLVILN